jgi:hypothetical protein
MFYRKPLLLAALLLLALVAACAPGQAAQPTTEPGAAEPPALGTPLTEPTAAETPATGNAADAITAAAVAQLAAELGLAEADVTVLSAEQTEFTDGCLGLGGPAESCLQAITPGWLVMLSANGQEYEVHTDATGQQVRIAAEGSSAPSDPDAATAAAVAALAKELGVPESDITLASLEAADYTDSCLGLGGPEESCLQVITLGWLIRLDAAGQTYEVHTDGTGQIVRIAPSQ